MSKVIEICITKNSGNKMHNVSMIEVVESKGIINDRYFSENQNFDTQITLIESENIDNYNNLKKTKIPYIDFRRNIVTNGLILNDLINKELLIGDAIIKVHRLCHPCKYLQEKLKQSNFIKEFLHKGGLRCEILTDGKINVVDIIK